MSMFLTIFELSLILNISAEDHFHNIILILVRQLLTHLKYFIGNSIPEYMFLD